MFTLCGSTGVQHTGRRLRAQVIHGMQRTRVAAVPRELNGEGAIVVMPKRRANTAFCGCWLFCTQMEGMQRPASLGAAYTREVKQAGHPNAIAFLLGCLEITTRWKSICKRRKMSSIGSEAKLSPRWLSAFRRSFSSWVKVAAT